VKKNPIPKPECPLKDKKKENFCQVFAGNPGTTTETAYREAYPGPDNKNAYESAKKLLQEKKVFERIRYLRDAKLLELKIDKLWIAEQRREIIKNAEKESDRLNALKDLEKNLQEISEQERKHKNTVIVFNSKDRTE
jgi:ribonuclease HI